MEDRHINIGTRRVGPDEAPLIIAEVAQSHDGSLGMAHAYIDAAAKSGADAIKFQTHIAAAESTPGEPWRVKFSPQDTTRYEYWKRMEFAEEHWVGLAAHAREAGILFLSSPFSLEAVELLLRVGVPAWKIGSGEVSNDPLIDRVASTGLPVLLSSGMSSWAELDRAVDRIRARGAPMLVFQCTTAYPCPPSRLGLNIVQELATRYRCPVGLSDHSATVFPAVAATALGANAVEVHLTLSRDAFGPDVSSSVTVEELRELVRGTRLIHEAIRNPIDKDGMAEDLAELKRIFGKSLAVTKPLTAGSVLTAMDLTTKKPGSGIPAARLDEYVGRTLRRDVSPDVLLAEADLV